jgi:hypothetical protein
MRCNHCHVDGVLYRQINASGAKVVVERCPKCRRNTVPGKPFLSKNGHDWDALPLFEDYNKESHQCEYEGCTRTDTQLHHYSPRHLFADADKWAQQYLCSLHHSIWHKLTQTGSYFLDANKEKRQWQSRH